MHHAEGHVARFVLRAKAVDVLFRVVVRHQFAHAEERQHRSFAADVQPRRHLREVARGVDVPADHALHTAVAPHQTATVGERALTEDVQVACLIHHLGDEVHARLVVVRCHLGDPLARHVARDELDLRDEGRELAFRPLDVIGQGLNRVPGDVSGGGPLARDRFFVQLGAIAQPHVRLRLHGVVAHPRHARARDGAARPTGRVLALIRDIRREPGIDVLELKAAFALSRVELPSPDIAAFEPAEVVALLRAIFLISLERVLGCYHHVVRSPRECVPPTPLLR